MKKQALEEKMELVERYIREVGRRLPQKQRADVEAELRSLIMDALEAHSGSAEAEGDEEAQVAVLQELGAPAEVAARYAPAPRYVIGPRLYDAYLRVVSIVMGAVALALMISTVVNLLQTQPEGINLLAAFGELILQYISAAAGAIGFTTVIFAILERTLSDEDIADLKDEDVWDPRTLPHIEDHDRIQPVAMIVGICFTVLAVVLFNLFADRLGIVYMQTEQGWRFAPMLSATALKTYLPLWNIGWGLSLALSLVVLQQGRWQRSTRLLELGLKGFTLYVLVRMLTGPVLWAPLTGWVGVDMPLVETLLTQVFRWALIIAVIATVVEMAQSVYRLIRQR